PPSARRAAPLVADASFELIAISSTLAKRCSSEVGRNCLTNGEAASSTDWPFCLARSFTNVSTPGRRRDVGGNAADFVAGHGLRDRRDRGVDLALRPAIDHDGRACRGKSLGNGMADAAGRACDQSRLCREIDFHETSPSSMTMI